MASPIEFNLNIIKGDDFKDIYQLLDDDSVEINLTGYS